MQSTVLPTLVGTSPPCTWSTQPRCTSHSSRRTDAPPPAQRLNASPPCTLRPSGCTLRASTRQCQRKQDETAPALRAACAAHTSPRRQQRPRRVRGRRGRFRLHAATRTTAGARSGKQRSSLRQQRADRHGPTTCVGSPRHDAVAASVPTPAGVAARVSKIQDSIDLSISGRVPPRRPPSRRAGKRRWNDRWLSRIFAEGRTGNPKNGRTEEQMR